MMGALRFIFKHGEYVMSNVIGDDFYVKQIEKQVTNNWLLFKAIPQKGREL